MSRFLRLCAFLSVVLFSTNLFAAGYTCETYRKYTSCQPGYYMTVDGEYNATPTLGNKCTICPAGSFCAGGTSDKESCPAGTYGATTGLKTNACSGQCAAGYYCPAGSTSSQQTKCPNNWTSAAGAGEIGKCYRQIPVYKSGGTGKLGVPDNVDEVSRTFEGFTNGYTKCYYGKACSLYSITNATSEDDTTINHLYNPGYTYCGGYSTSPQLRYAPSCTTTTSFTTTSTVVNYAFYASRRSNKCTVSVDPNGGSFASLPAAKTWYHGMSLSGTYFTVPTAPDVTKTFAGYATASGEKILGPDLKAINSNWDSVEVGCPDGGTLTLYAVWVSADAIHCDLKYYLPKNSTTCVTCTPGNYCLGGDFDPSTTADQGLTKCPAGTYNPDTGSSSSSACSVCSGAGTYSGAGASSCSSCASLGNTPSQATAYDTSIRYTNEAGGTAADHAGSSSCKITCPAGMAVWTQGALCGVVTPTFYNAQFINTAIRSNSLQNSMVREPISGFPLGWYSDEYTWSYGDAVMYRVSRGSYPDLGGVKLCADLPVTPTFQQLGINGSYATFKADYTDATAAAHAGIGACKAGTGGSSTFTGGATLRSTDGTTLNRQLVGCSAGYFCPASNVYGFPEVVRMGLQNKYDCDTGSTTYSGANIWTSDAGASARTQCYRGVVLNKNGLSGTLTLDSGHNCKGISDDGGTADATLYVYHSTSCNLPSVTADWTYPESPDENTPTTFVGVGKWSVFPRGPSASGISAITIADSDSHTLYAQKTVTCGAGNYLKATAEVCTVCLEGYYCPRAEGQWPGHLDGTTLTACGGDWMSDAGAGTHEQCYYPVTLDKNGFSATLTAGAGCEVVDFGSTINATLKVHYNTACTLPTISSATQTGYIDGAGWALTSGFTVPAKYFNTSPASTSIPVRKTYYIAKTGCVKDYYGDIDGGSCSSCSDLGFFDTTDGVSTLENEALELGMSACYGDVALDKNGFSGTLTKDTGTGCKVAETVTGTTNGVLKFYYNTACTLPTFSGTQTGYTNATSWSHDPRFNDTVLTTMPASNTVPQVMTLYARKGSCAGDYYRKNSSTCDLCSSLPNTSEFYSKSAAGTRSDSSVCYGITTAGYYVETPGANQVECTAGGYCQGNVMVYYNSTGGRRLCEAGTANPNTGSSEHSACVTCAEGTYTDSAGSTSCSTCTDGFFCPGGTRETCPDDFFRSDVGATNIKQCFSDAFTLNLNGFSGTLDDGVGCTVEPAAGGAVLNVYYDTKCTLPTNTLTQTGYMPTTTWAEDWNIGSEAVSEIPALTELPTVLTYYARKVACAATYYKSANSTCSACSSLANTNGFYSKSVAGTASDASVCFGTTTAGKYIKTANSGTQEACPAGSRCPAREVFYGDFDTTGGGRIECSNWTYSGSEAAECTACPTVEDGYTKLDSTGTGWTTYQKCVEIATESPANCSSGKLQKIPTASGAITWASATVNSSNPLSANPGYHVNGTSCTVCDNGTFYGGGTATSCTPCPTLTEGYDYVSGTGWTTYSNCKETKAYSSVSANCDGGALTKTAVSATAWGAVTSTLTAKAGYGVSGSGDTTTCSECGGGKWSAAKSATCSSIDAGCYGTSASSACPAKCVMGSYSTGGTSACTACEGGKTNSADGSTSCTVTCSNNAGVATNGWETPTWSANTVTNLCTVKAAGCASNYYKNSNACATCASGTNSKYTLSAAGTTTVNNCYLEPTAKNYVATAGQGLVSCAQGGYCPGSTTENPIKIYYGGTASSTHLTTGGRTDCPAGSFCAAGVSAGTKCAIGSYSAEGASACTACEGGKTTSATGQTSCNADCSNNSGVYGWATPAWSANTVANLCKVNTCASKYYKNSNACALCSGLAEGFYPNSDNGNSSGTNACRTASLSGKYVKAANDSAATDCDNWTYKGAHTVNYGETSSCDDCLAVPSAVSGVAWTKATGTGWTSYSNCVVTQTPANCASGSVQKKQSSASAWGSTTLASTLKSEDGYYASTSATACTAAGDGYYAKAGATSATACATGSYSEKTSASANCIECPAGRTTSGTGTKYNATANTACAVTCSNATGAYAWATPAWSANTVANLCTVSSCNANTYYTATTGNGYKNTCSSCGSNSSTSAGNTSTTCTCAAGHTAGINAGSVDGDATTKSSACELISDIACSIGQYVKAKATSCSVCEAGYHCPSSAKTYSYSSSIQGRTECSAGTYQPDTGKTSCLSADKGYYVSGTAKTAQTACTDATYQNETGQTSCKECPAGYTANTDSAKTAATSCQISCAPGTQVATANAQCTTPSGNWYTTASQLVNYGSTSSVNACKVATNLFNPSDYDSLWGYLSSSSTTVTAYDKNAIVWVPVEPNTTYIVSGMRGANSMTMANSASVPAFGVEFSNFVNPGSVGKGMLYTTSSDAKYLILMGLRDADGATTSTRQSILDKNVANLQIFKASDGYGIVGNATTDHDAATDCMITCGAGQYVATAGAGCVNVGVDTTTNTGYWGAGGTISQTATLARNKCDTGLITTGSGTGANEAADCGRKLHAGDNVIYLRSAERTSPSLRVKVGDTTFYGALSTALSGALKVSKDGTKYSVVNDWQ